MSDKTPPPIPEADVQPELELEDAPAEDTSLEALTDPPENLLDFPGGEGQADAGQAGEATPVEKMMSDEDIDEMLFEMFGEAALQADKELLDEAGEVSNIQLFGPNNMTMEVPIAFMALHKESGLVVKTKRLDALFSVIEEHEHTLSDVMVFLVHASTQVIKGEFIGTEGIFDPIRIDTWPSDEVEQDETAQQDDTVEEEATAEVVAEAPVE